MAGLSLSDHAKRPNYNTTVGQPIKLKTNHFQVTSLPNGIIHQYDVQIVPPKKTPDGKPPGKDFAERIWRLEALQSKLGPKKVIFNGAAIAWSMGPLPFGKEMEAKLELSSGSKGATAPAPTATIKIKQTTTFNLQVLQQYIERKYSMDDAILQSISLLDNLLKQGPASRFPTKKGNNSFFDDSIKDDVFDIGGGAQVWRGVFQSARVGCGFVTVNVDVCHTAFYIPHIPVIGLLVETLNKRSEADIGRLTPRDVRTANQTLSLLKIYTKHMQQRTGPPKVMTVKSLSKDSAAKFKFEKDGNMISVAQYFKTAYNIQLKYPTFPMLEMSKGEMLPIELAFVAHGQPFPQKRLTGNQVSEIIKFAAQPPANRLKAITANVEKLNWANDAHLKDYGMKIKTTPFEADGRLLPAPAITYGPVGPATSVIRPREGKWDFRRSKFISTTPLVSWGIVNFTRDDEGRFLQDLISAATGKGINIQSKKPPIISANPSANVEKTIQAHFKTVGNTFNKFPQILFFIVGKKGVDDIYGEIKRVCDTNLGVPSQVLQGRMVSKAGEQYACNVLMKVNVKMGGQNTQLAKNPFDAPTLLLGADVSHPPPGMGAPSLSSLVANIDIHGTKFTGQARAQAPRLELIADLGLMTSNAIIAYKDISKQVPKRVLYFRDGVSEGQFQQVKDQELKAIKEALNKNGCAAAKVSVIIVQKRHHTRLFPAQAKDGDRNGNVKPGTVLDSGITHPVEFDFFLTAHTSFKGTARPTHYHCIHDENAYKAEALQKLVHDMCYTYARSTTAVSLIPVTYYAHLVGNRVKAYAQSSMSDTASSKSGSVSDFGQLAALHDKLRHIMWYI